jgi:hypothetical protein
MQVKVEYLKAVHIVPAMLELVLLLLCPPLQRNLVLVVYVFSIEEM